MEDFITKYVNLYYQIWKTLLPNMDIFITKYGNLYYQYS
jgi:hypothetical protein